jgi:DUF1680 family protein
LTADYGISSYYPTKEGIYVNLFLPSRVTWTQNNTECTLTQQTSYPTTNTTQFEMKMARAENFTMYLRIPAWADKHTRISVNGKRVEGDVIAGKFFPLTRTWNNGDRVGFEIGMAVRLQPVDAQNPQLVALIRGPIAMFATGNLPANFSRAQLLAASASGASSEDWIVQNDAGKVTFRPFAAIGDETYRLYNKVEA